MNKFKKILLGTMLGLAVAAPSVGMVGCSRLGPDPNVPIEEPEDPQEPENPQEETEELSYAKVKKDYLKELKSIAQTLVEKNYPEYFKLADRLSVIDQQIFEAQKELNEIAELHNVEVESVEINENGDAWVANEGVEESRVEALVNSIKTLKAQRTEIEEEIEDFVLDHEEDELDFGLLAEQLGNVLGGITYPGDELSLFSNFKQDKYYINEENDQFYGIFKIDENTIVALRGEDGLWKIEYKDGNLSKVTYITDFGHDIEVFDIANGIFAYAHLEDNTYPEPEASEGGEVESESLDETDEEVYSPFKNFNDGKFTLDDLDEMLGHNFEFGYTKFAGGEISENGYSNDVSGEAVAESARTDILGILRVFQECGLKMPMVDIVDEYYALLPEFSILENYEDSFSWDDVEYDDELSVGPRTVDETKSFDINKFYDFVNSLYAISSAASYQELQIVKVPKFTYTTEQFTAPKAVTANGIRNTFTQVGVYDMVVPAELTGALLSNLQVFNIESSWSTFNYIDQHGDDEAQVYRTEDEYWDGDIDNFDWLFNYFNEHQSDNLVKLGAEDTNVLGLPVVNLGDDYLVIGSVVDEEGEEFFGMIPYSHRITF